MNTCPKCSHQWPDDKRASGGKARWRGMSKSQRQKSASQAAKARWARRQNASLALDKERVLRDIVARTDQA